MNVTCGMRNQIESPSIWMRSQSRNSGDAAVKTAQFGDTIRRRLRAAHPVVEVHAARALAVVVGHFLLEWSGRRRRESSSTGSGDSCGRATDPASSRCAGRAHRAPRLPGRSCPPQQPCRRVGRPAPFRERRSRCRQSDAKPGARSRCRTRHREKEASPPDPAASTTLVSPRSAAFFAVSASMASVRS